LRCIPNQADNALHGSAKGTLSTLAFTISSVVNQVPVSINCGRSSAQCLES
jgi:hypothetical protein